MRVPGATANVGRCGNSRACARADVCEEQPTAIAGSAVAMGFAVLNLAAAFAHGAP